MSTDRELTELAAKAVGVAGHYVQITDTYGEIHVDAGWTHHAFNPLVSDGDALRLAVMLNMDVMGEGTLKDGTPCRSVVFPVGGDFDALSEPEGADPFAAIRRAITRAAAKIGRAA